MQSLTLHLYLSLYNTLLLLFGIQKTFVYINIHGS